MGTGSYRHARISAYRTAADYSTTGQYLFVLLSANDTVTKCSTKGENAIGVLKTATGSAKVAEVFMLGGGALVECAEAIALNEQITTDANGKAINPDSSGQAVLGIALEAGDSGDVISVMLNSGGETFAAEA